MTTTGIYFLFVLFCFYSLFFARSDVWLGPAGTIMLRADVEPLYSPALPNCISFVDGSGAPRNPGCVLNAQGQVAQFAGNQALFYSTFQTAWQKLVDFQYGNLTLSMRVGAGAATERVSLLLLAVVAVVFFI
jgi:hypothetical protein